MQNICFVCDGNTCRSPFAEKIMNKLLKQNNLNCFKCYSVGINANVLDNINPYVTDILKSYKITAKKRKAKRLTNACYKKYNLFITMTKSQKLDVLANNVFSFGEMVDGIDIVDPYGGEYNDYLAMTNQVFDYCNKLIKKIKLLKENN